MTEWLVCVVLYLILAVLWGTGVRRARRNPSRPIPRRFGRFAVAVRGQHRQGFLSGVMLFAGFGGALTRYGAAHLGGAAGDICLVLLVALFLVFLSAFMLMGTVQWLNWPAVVLPPSLRDGPDHGAELRGRRRERRSADQSKL